MDQWRIQMLTIEKLIEDTTMLLMNGRRTIESRAGSLNCFDLKKILEKLVQEHLMEENKYNVNAISDAAWHVPIEETKDAND
jgi:hypothetical protein